MVDPQPPRDINNLSDYEKGFVAGAQMMMDKRLAFVSFEDEVAMPLEWVEYTNDEERQVISQIVAMPEYKNTFRENMLRQGQMKWRQARLQKKDLSTRFCLELGNFIISLVNFYDSAGNMEQPGSPPPYSFDNILSELDSWSR